MFTGIIEQCGTVERVQEHGSNRVLWIRAAMSAELHPDQSVAHDGVCLTVEAVEGGAYRVAVIAESLSKSTLGELAVGSLVNLERCIRGDTRMDGHFVQGHVDTTGSLLSRHELDGSWDLWVAYPASFRSLVVPRGSIALNGISLTIAELRDEQPAFKVSIIPYTMEYTNLGSIAPGDRVNLEFDVLGKYATRFLELREAALSSPAPRGV